jgi:hypothetical protein
MAASPTVMDSQDKWGPTDGQGDTMGPSGNADAENGAPLLADAGQGSDNPDFTRGSSVGGVSGGSKGDASFREKQVKVLRVSSSLVRYEWSLACAVDLFLCLLFRVSLSTGLRGWFRLLLLLLFYSYACFLYTSTRCLLSAV